MVGGRQDVGEVVQRAAAARTHRMSARKVELATVYWISSVVADSPMGAGAGDRRKMCAACHGRRAIHDVVFDALYGCMSRY